MIAGGEPLMTLEQRLPAFLTRRVANFIGCGVCCALIGYALYAQYVQLLEPCSLCLSGITWSGFDNFYYLFGYEDTRDLFGIPHDIRILREVYAVPDPDRGYVPPDRPLYNRSNAYFTGHAIMALIGGLDRGSREALTARVDNLSATYRELSDAYQRSKGLRGIPLA